MDKNVQLLELAIKKKQLDLFFQGNGFYSLGENPFEFFNRSVKADEALHVIYRYHKENPTLAIYREIEETLINWLAYKSGKGIYKAFIVLATMRREELAGRATFSCRFDYLSKRISEAVLLFKDKLLLIKEMESEENPLGMWGELMYENQYHFDKYGFLIIKFANDGEREKIEEYIATNFGLKNERLEKAVNKLIGYEDICRECLYWISTGNYVEEGKCVEVEGYSAKKIAETTYLNPIGAFNYLISLRKNPKEALDNLKKGLPRK